MRWRILLILLAIVSNGRAYLLADESEAREKTRNARPSSVSLEHDSTGRIHNIAIEWTHDASRENPLFGQRTYQTQVSETGIDGQRKITVAEIRPSRVRDFREESPICDAASGICQKGSRTIVSNGRSTLETTSDTRNSSLKVRVNRRRFRVFVFWGRRR